MDLCERTMPRRARAIAFYLPQFHPIPENDEWWGKGFTEWTNVAKAKPLFKGHYQPRLPADLGYYDLRVPEVREAQAKLASDAGVEAFCYWHYWFAGERLLERPFDEVLKSGCPDFPFCLGWANETWSGIWHGAAHRILKEQTYPGEDDYRRHFEFLLRAFRDRRYVTVDGKPLLFIYRPLSIPDSRKAMDLWRDLAAQAGLPGIHIVAYTADKAWDARGHGFDAKAVLVFQGALLQCRPILARARLKRFCSAGRWSRLRPVAERLYAGPEHVYRYADAIENFAEMESEDCYPQVIPNWDNTPRSGSRGWVLHDSSPEDFRKHLRRAIERVQGRPRERGIVFLKSWNEWAEGNYVEPDQRYGHGYLDVLRQELLGASVPSTLPEPDALALAAG